MQCCAVPHPSPLARRVADSNGHALQVATDTRLWLVAQLRDIRSSLADLIRASAARAEQDVDVLMPGFTHLQPAMTVRWSHWLLSHAAAWQRDDMRLRDLMPRVAMLPLGSGGRGCRCPCSAPRSPVCHDHPAGSPRRRFAA